MSNSAASSNPISTTRPSSNQTVVVEICPKEEAKLQELAVKAKLNMWSC